MQDILNKIISNKDMARKSEELNKQGKKIVMVNGVFDLLHVGHINLLRNAKKNGDVLIAAMNSDSSVNGYKNGRPIINEKDRAVALASLFFVDYVTIFKENKPLKLIEAIKPDILAKGVYYDPTRVDEEAELMKKLGGRVIKIKHPIKISTSQIIDKIRGAKLV